MEIRQIRKATILEVAASKVADSGVSLSAFKIAGLTPSATRQSCITSSVHKIGAFEVSSSIIPLIKVSAVAVVVTKLSCFATRQTRIACSIIKTHAFEVVCSRQGKVYVYVKRTLKTASNVFGYFIGADYKALLGKLGRYFAGKNQK